MLPIIKGIQAGVILALMAFGPSFFYMIRVGIKKGFKEAALFALGIALSDVLMIVLILLGLGPFFKLPIVQEVFSLVTGCAILVLGIVYLFRKPHVPAENGAENKRKVIDLPFYMYTIKGFSINLLNPFTFLIWVAVTSTIVVNTSFTNIEFAEFFVAVIAVILFFDVLKAYFANWLGKVITDKVLHIIDRCLGVVFILLSFRLFYHFVELFWLKGN